MKKKFPDYVINIFYVKLSLVGLLNVKCPQKALYYYILKRYTIFNRLNLSFD